jgi:tetratricopeptide (TPR) repeat protein
MGMENASRLLVQAAEHYNAGRPRPAGTLCADILSAHPDHLPALHLAAVIALAEGRMEDGRELLGRVFGLDPDHAPALSTLGDALAVNGEQEAAVAVFQRAVALRPLDATLHGKLGVALSELSRLPEAEASYRRALALDPDLIQARFNLATALAGQLRPTEAEQMYRAVIAREPCHQGAWINLGNLLADQNKPRDAVAAYRKALENKALENKALENKALGNETSAGGRGAGAALTSLAGCLCELGELDEAMEACERALSLDANYAPAHTNLGNILDARGRFEDAVTAHRRAVAADPAYAKGHANLAVALRVIGQLDEALAASHRAVALDRNDPLVRFNHAHVLLMNGHLADGFEEFRWGRKCREWSEGYPALAEPEWQGEALAGRTLLLYAEAGLGDTLQFVRYLPMLAKEGGPIVLQVQPPLVPLLRANRGVTVIARGEPLPRFDLHLPLMDLPRVFGTTLETIPAAIPYLRPDPAKLSRWRSALDDETALRVGVVWAGNPRHKGDRQRSLPAEELLPRLVMPGVKLFSLQKDLRAADAPAVAALGRDIVDLALRLGDFSDTAAAVTALDLVIAVDTSVAHLAGALGRPVWTLLPYALDWRWLRDREDTPWYPSMRLFRQRAPLAWDDVVARMSAELARVASGQRDLLWPPGADIEGGSHAM